MTWQARLVPNAGNARTYGSSTSRDLCVFEATYTYAEGVSTTLSLPWSLFEHVVGNGMMMIPKNREGVINLAKWLQAQIDPAELDKPIPEMPAISAWRLTEWLNAGRKASTLIEDLSREGMGGSAFGSYPLPGSDKPGT